MKTRKLNSLEKFVIFVNTKLHKLGDNYLKSLSVGRLWALARMSNSHLCPFAVDEIARRSGENLDYFTKMHLLVCLDSHKAFLVAHPPSKFRRFIQKIIQKSQAV